MRCQVPYSDFRAATDFISHALGDKRSPLPILSYVLADIKDGQLSLQSTNIEIAATYRLPVISESMEHWRAAAPGWLLIDLVGLFSDHPIDLKAEALTLTLQSETTTSTLKCLSADDFPLIPQAEGESWSWSVPLAELQRMLRTVIYATAKDNPPELMSVLFEIEPGRMTLVATNRSQLACSSILCPTPDRHLQLIVPANNCRAILKMLDKEDGEVQITCTDNHIWFKAERWEIFSTLLQRKYPDYKPIMNNQFSTTVRFATPDLMLACQQALIFAKDINDAVQLTIEGEQMTVRAEGGQLGDGGASLPIELEGDPLTIAFNGTFLKTMLQTMDDKATLCITPSRHIGRFEDDHSQHFIASLKMS